MADVQIGTLCCADRGIGLSSYRLLYKHPARRVLAFYLKDAITGELRFVSLRFAPPVVESYLEDNTEQAIRMGWGDLTSHPHYFDRW